MGNFILSAGFPQWMAQLIFQWPSKRKFIYWMERISSKITLSLLSLGTLC
jgi:hypothetical protein